MDASGRAAEGPPVRVLRAELDRDDATLAELWATLDDEERARADARAGSVERRRFIADHGLRRRTLGRLLGCAPGAVRIAPGEHGRPELPGTGLHFSATRSDEVAVHAVSDRGAVGVDVERIDADQNPDRLAARILAPAERAAYAALDPSARPAAITAAFARKEAWFKAAGTGLVFPQSATSVWSPDGAALSLAGITVRDLALGAGRAAALATTSDVAVPGDWSPVVERLD